MYNPVIADESNMEPLMEVFENNEDALFGVHFEKELDDMREYEYEYEIESEYKTAIENAVHSWVDECVKSNETLKRVHVRTKVKYVYDTRDRIEFSVRCILNGRTIWFKRFETTVYPFVINKIFHYSKQGTFGDFFGKIRSLDDLKKSGMTPGDILNRIKQSRKFRILDCDWEPLFKAFEEMQKITQSPAPRAQEQALEEMYEILHRKLMPGPVQF